MAGQSTEVTKEAQSQTAVSKDAQVVVSKNAITLAMPNPYHLNFIVENNGGSVSPRVIHATEITLSKGTVYILPIKEQTKYEDFYAIKVASNFRTKIEVLDVADGYVTLRCIIHGIVLRDGEEIAQLL